MQDKSFGKMPKNSLSTGQNRILTLILTLTKHKSGLSFQSIQNYMREFYHSENEESSQKKIQRDMNQILQLGFPIKIDSNYHYKIDVDALIDSTKLFSREEKIWISNFYINTNVSSPEIQTLLFKIFRDDLELLSRHRTFSHTTNLENEESEDKLFLKLGTFIQNKIPCMFEYKSKLRTIEPYNLLKKNYSKHYLYAFERESREYKFYLVEKIHNCKKINGEFQSPPPNQDIEMNNPLSFPISKSETYSITVTDSKIDHAKQFLKGIPYQESKGKFQFSSSNPEYLYTFLWELDKDLVQIEPDEKRIRFLDFLNSIYDLSRDFIK